mmetsp:Transcript_16939/g.20425  ORF Transcript_16939/g.20425 Transcript_16939/m.20425 type:complete len:173 (+) Transcript_16939:83-601(+)
MCSYIKLVFVVVVCTTLVNSLESTSAGQRVEGQVAEPYRFSTEAISTQVKGSRRLAWRQDGWNTDTKEEKFRGALGEELKRRFPVHHPEDPATWGALPPQETSWQPPPLPLFERPELSWLTPYMNFLLGTTIIAVIYFALKTLYPSMFDLSELWAPGLKPVPARRACFVEAQ